jgi:hypothetical protein
VTLSQNTGESTENYLIVLSLSFSASLLETHKHTHTYTHYSIFHSPYPYISLAKVQRFNPQCQPSSLISGLPTPLSPPTPTCDRIFLLHPILDPPCHSSSLQEHQQGSNPIPAHTLALGNFLTILTPSPYL